MKKPIISTAVLAALAVAGSAQAANITSMSIEDINGDGIAGGFAFAGGTSATSKYTHFFDSISSVATAYATYTTDGGGIIPTGEQGSASTTAGDDSFTAGFAFNNYAFLPNSLRG